MPGGQDFFQIAAELSREKTPFAVITLLSTRGECPAEPGAKAIVMTQITPKGTEYLLAAGTVGGGKIEARAIVHAVDLMKRGHQTPDVQTWNLQKDIGMTCGGEVTMLFETHHAAPWKIALFGAGHVAQALVRVLASIDCDLTCIDSRPEWLEKLPPGTNRKHAPEPALEVKAFDEKTFFIVMTQGHSTDVPILEEIFRRFPAAPYIGSIGSDVKALKLRSDLKTRGVNAERLKCPIGLPIGGNAPGEIAISIAAQLLQSRSSSA